MINCAEVVGSLHLVLAVLLSALNQLILVHPIDTLGDCGIIVLQLDERHQNRERAATRMNVSVDEIFDVGVSHLSRKCSVLRYVNCTTCFHTGIVGQHVRRHYRDRLEADLLDRLSHGLR